MKQIGNTLNISPSQHAILDIGKVYDVGMAY